MAIGSEVYGSCTKEIDVSIEEGNGEERLCFGCKYFILTEAGKVAQVWRQWVLMVPGIGSRLELDGARYCRYRKPFGAGCEWLKK